MTNVMTNVTNQGKSEISMWPAKWQNLQDKELRSN